jgi:hypothetical protein
MKRNLILLVSLTVLPLTTPQASDPPTIRPGTYTVCDDSRDPSDTQSIHMKVGDKVRIGPIGAAAEVQFDERVVSMVASAEGRQLSTVVEFAHLQNGRAQMMKHLVRMVVDPGYDGTACNMGTVLAINFCPLAEDGTWQCRVLDCETEGACHNGDTHVQN